MYLTRVVVDSLYTVETNGDWAQLRPTLVLVAVAMQADMIHVMEPGRIVESGRHEDLLPRGGCYAQSWYAQMQRHNEVEQTES